MLRTETKQGEENFKRTVINIFRVKRRCISKTAVNYQNKEIFRETFQRDLRNFQMITKHKYSIERLKG